MSIEKDLKDNTAALNANTEILQKLYDLKVASVSTDSPAPVAAPAPAEVVPTAVVPPTPVAAPMTPEEFNEALVAEFKRIGSRDPIDSAMNEMGITSVTGLTAEQQQILITNVKAIAPVA